MRASTAIVLVIILVVGVGAALLARNLLSGDAEPQVVQPRPQEEKRERVLVANQRIGTGDLLTAAMLEWRPWPEDALADGYLRESQGTVMDDYYGSVANAVIQTGQPVTDDFIIKPGEGGFLAAVLQPGMRAISVSVNAATASAGLVLPGDQVDVVLTHRGEHPFDELPRMVSEIVLKDVRVIALDRALDVNGGAAERPPATATLEVAPDQVQKLILAGELGTLSLSLRAITEDEALEAKERRRMWEYDVSTGIARPGGNGSDVVVLRGSQTTGVEQDE